MTKAIKAGLLSAFLFPGSGQCYLKHYWRGLLMMLATLTGLTLIILRTTLNALDTLKVMQGSGTPIDVNSISYLADKTSANIFTDNTAVLIFIIACWIYSIIDAYLLGGRGVANN